MRRCRLKSRKEHTGGKFRGGEEGRREGREEGPLPFCSRETGGNIRWGRRSGRFRTEVHKTKKRDKNNKMTDVNMRKPQKNKRIFTKTSDEEHTDCETCLTLRQK